MPFWAKAFKKHVCLPQCLLPPSGRRLRRGWQSRGAKGGGIPKSGWSRVAAGQERPLCAAVRTVNKHLLPEALGVWSSFVTARVFFKRKSENSPPAERGQTGRRVLQRKPGECKSREGERGE